MSRLLEGKVAVVTGAGHGIGRGHALELAKHGATVVVNDLGTSVNGEGSGRDAEKVVDIITSRGGTAVPDFGDVGDEAQVEAMLDRAWDQFGHVDIIVNNAGIVRDRAIWNMSADDFDLVMRVHVRGTWLVCRGAARRWRAEAKAGDGSVYGRIINTVSGAGLLGHFGQSNYATAKSAIAGMTLTLSLELQSIGVTVNAIGPGGLTRLSATMPGQAAALEPDERDEDAFDPKDPSLCCPVVAWLASPEADHVSGQVIRAMGEKIHLMGGWYEKASAGNGQQRWDATKLGQVFATDVFGTRAPGLRMGG
ncbi:MAG: putative short-chain dehydrogenase/reductase [Modestobacter sp.]|jgi:NAD(P)-dependent dehydrogenase (short-subunit alcohol dehydrogenase family)|nr:putative short-chain dehydrogenase/reductase [Modestobacter sp.]MCW2510772.1 putative short-chain dehydrogenase/reductase [Modestobacter sp.]MCW2574609.1 putative short-chain dehydrogenase/reductase [Modestobacter sp.]MCW2619045.1 putative short-chain dehydrogenase/reductase [Modestobacter sp.]